MPAWDDEQMGWRLRLDVAHDDRRFAALDDLRGDLAGNNAAEDTLLHRYRVRTVKVHERLAVFPAASATFTVTLTGPSG